MKKYLLILAAVAGLVMSCSVDSKTVVCKGDVKEQAYDFTDFSCVTVNGAADIELLQGDFLVEVTANEQVFEHLDYHVDNGELILETKNNVNIQADTYKLKIQAPDLTALVINGAAKINTPEGIASENEIKAEINGAAKMKLSGVEAPALAVIINGAGKVKLLDINVGALEVVVNGAGSVSVTGKAGSAQLTVAGTAKIDATALDCADVHKSVDGIASIKL